MSKNPKIKDPCACCGAPLPQGPSNRTFDRDLQGHVGRCCIRELAEAEFALSHANLHDCVPEKEDLP